MLSKAHGAQSSPDNGLGAVPQASDRARLTGPLDILHLAELVPVVRQRFALPATLADDAILASLRAIAGHSDQRARWRAAFSSNLGAILALQGRDLNTTLTTLLALLPRPLS
jgi:hypothetical protein